MAKMDKDMNNEMTPEDARDALHSGTRSARALRGRARWSATKLTVYGLGFALLTVAVGLIESTAVFLVVFGSWGVLVGLMAWWERRRSAYLAGTASRITPYWVMTITAYAIALAVGVSASDPGAAYWLVAAGIVAAPMLIGAGREVRA